MTVFQKRCVRLLAIALTVFGLFLLTGEKPGWFRYISSSVRAWASDSEPLARNLKWYPNQRLLAAQVLIFKCQSYKEVEESIIELKSTGINTLIVRAFQNRGDRMHGFARPQSQVGVYFESANAKVVDPLLARIVSIGQRHGLKVFAWMETRKMPLILNEPSRAQALRYDFDKRGFIPMPMWSIFAKQVEERLMALYQDVVRTGIDGILFQDDLIMYQYEDFSAEAVALFERETGETLSPTRLYLSLYKSSKGRWYVREYSDTFWSWSRWKNQKLLAFTNKLISAAKSVNPRIKFALNFMYESVTDPDNALAWLSQDLEKSTKLPLDFYAIMAYHRQMKKELQLSDEETYEKIATMTAKLLKLFEDPKKILMKIQIRDWDTLQQIPLFEVSEVLKRINSQGRVSLAFVPYSAKHPLHAIGYHLH